MVLNGLGFSNRPMSLTPQFFENKPMALLFRDGVSSDSFNRFKLGRSLDKAFSYGCDMLFSEIALSVCQQEDIDLRFNCLDTTSFSLTGEYMPDSDEHAIEAVAVTYGYSKDHRPDLKQAVLELMVSQDGGVPFLSKSWDGNASDNAIFKERSAALLHEFSASSGPRYLIADSKVYTKKNGPNLAQLPFITRIPGSLNDVTRVIGVNSGCQVLFFRVKNPIPLFSLFLPDNLMFLTQVLRRGYSPPDTSSCLSGDSSRRLDRTPRHDALAYRSGRSLMMSHGASPPRNVSSCCW